jgi:hypothetical protein
VLSLAERRKGRRFGGSHEPEGGGIDWAVFGGGAQWCRLGWSWGGQEQLPTADWICVSLLENESNG